MCKFLEENRGIMSKADLDEYESLHQQLVYTQGTPIIQFSHNAISFRLLPAYHRIVPLGDMILEEFSLPRKMFA